MIDDATLRRVLADTRVIALVGASARSERPSHRVMGFLQGAGYRVIPVNPGLAGQTLLGETVQASLADCPAEVDMIDIFRQSDAVPAIVEQALAHLPALRTVWMQLGVASPEGRKAAEAHGLTVIENRCPAIEYPRLFG